MVYTQVEHAGADRPMIAEVAQLHPVQTSLYPRGHPEVCLSNHEPNVSEPSLPMYRTIWIIACTVAI